MSVLEAVLTANAGFILLSGGKSILIDALHDEKTAVFSTMSATLIERAFAILEENPPCAMLLTHRHPDHYSPKLTERVLLRWPECELLAPEDFDSENDVYSRDNLLVRAIHTRHDGDGFENVENLCFLLRFGGFEILAPGDTAPKEREKLSALTQGGQIDLALLNFPWITLSAPREFVKDELRPRHAAIAHLPFAREETEGFIPAASAGIKRLSGIDARLMTEPLQCLRLEKSIYNI